MKTLKKLSLIILVLISISAQSQTAIFTVDDGHESDYTYYAPLLNSYGIKLTSYIVPSFIDSGTIMRYGKSMKFMSWDQVKELHEKGNDIESHSWSHPYLSRLNQEQILDQLVKVDSAFVVHGFPLPKHFAYPYGDYNENVRKITDQYYFSCRSVSPGINYESTNKHLLMNCRLDMKVGDIGRLTEIKEKINLAARTKGVIVFDGHIVLPDSLYTPQTTHTIPLFYLKEIIEYCQVVGMNFSTIKEYYGIKEAVEK